MTDISAIDVCICTIDRASLADTLASVASQQVPNGIQLRIIVADNSVDGAAKVRIAETVAGLAVPVTCVHAPARNISIARNACLDAATGSHIAFIDDDEIAPPGWLSALIGAAATHDVVFGPVRAVYDPATAPAWMITGDFHSTGIGPRDKPSKGYTGNVLIDRSFIATHHLRFDRELGQIGGEDTMFFLAAYRAGGRFGFVPEAEVTEPVPSHRAQTGWLIKRQFRSGQIHELELRQSDGRIAVAALAIPKAAVSLALAGIWLFVPRQRMFHLLRAAFHTGVIAAMLGTPLYKEYAAPAADPRSG